MAETAPVFSLLSFHCFNLQDSEVFFMELWDLLDENGSPTGRTHVRGEDFPPGVYHRTVEIFTVNSRGELLLTLRAPDKLPFPSMWEVTGGSVLAGEDSLTAAMRELREETGIDAGAGEIKFLLTSRGRTAFMDIYLVRKNVEISNLIMQEGETVAAKWVTFGEFERMIENGEVPEPVYRRYYIVKDILTAKMS